MPWKYVSPSGGTSRSSSRSRRWVRVTGRVSTVTGRPGLRDDPARIDIRGLVGPDGVDRVRLGIEDDQRAHVLDAEDADAPVEAPLGEPEVAVEVGPDLPRAFPAPEVRDGARGRPREHVERSREAHLVKRPEDGEPEAEAGAEDRLASRALARAEPLAPREHGAHGARIEQRHARRVRGVDQEVAQVPEGEGERPAPVDQGERQRREGSRARGRGASGSASGDRPGARASPRAGGSTGR